MESTLPQLHFDDTVARLAAAAFLGALIGFEREWRERAAGLRTHMMVTVGAAVFTMVSAYGWDAWYDTETMRVLPFDPTRIAAQVVSGIGFLGAGAILRSGINIRGLTTAASLWASAAIGMASGAGNFQLAALATFFCLFTLIGLRRLPDSLINRMHHRRLLVRARLRERVDCGVLIDALERMGGEIRQVELESDQDNVHRAVVAVEVTKATSEHHVLRELSLLDELRSLRVEDANKT